MNSPAHLVLNLALLHPGADRKRCGAVLVGAALPDLPMLVFYISERWIAGNSEQTIWRQRYYDPTWQAFIDCFNSLPLIGLGFLIAARSHAWLRACLASMALHCLLDLPLHNDDAHRHFFPLSDWRFASPVSYWDPAHYGNTVTFIEVGLVLVVALHLWNRYGPSWDRRAVVVITGVYLIYGIFAYLVWM